MVLGRTAYLCRFATSVLLAYGVLCAAVHLSGAAELIVTDQAGGRVMAFDAETGAFTRTLMSGLQQPSAITRGPAGLLLVTDLLAGTVVQINPVTGANSVFASGIDRPGAIAYDEWAGTVIVGEFGDPSTSQYGDQVFMFAPNGALIPSWTINAGAHGHAGITTDVHGNLYVANFSTNAAEAGNVVHYSTPWEPNAYTPLGVFAQSELLKGAAGMAFDFAGNLFVAGMRSGAGEPRGGVVKFLVTGEAVTGVVDFDSDIASPSGITLMPDGSIVVASLGDGTLYKYNTTTGARVDLLGGLYDANFNNVGGIDGGDLAEWRGAFGGGSTADADGDGDSDGSDFLAWQRAVGGAGFAPSGVVWYNAPAVGAVPEPCGGVAAVIALVGGQLARRYAGRTLRKTSG